jgi:hypothetical protein
MNNDAAKTIFGLGVVTLAAFVALVAASQSPSPGPNFEPLPPTQLDLSDVFAGNPNAAQRREHARALADVFSIAAASVEFDGREDEAERLFRTGANVDDHIVRVRKFYTQRWSFAEQYPKLGAAIGTYLKQRLGTDLGDQLTNQRRADWIQALREVQASALEI